MNVDGEEGDVNEETIASWQERAREIMRGLDGPVLESSSNEIAV